MHDAFEGSARCLELSVTTPRGASSRTRKVGAGFRALLTPAPSSKLLIWHAGLLSLVPALDRAGAQTILFLHGVEAWAPLRHLPTRFLERVDLFLTNSYFTWERFLLLHPELADRQHRAIPLGVGEPAPTSSPGEPPTAVMISRLVRSEDYKGHRQVIRVWSRLREEIADARLVIVGDGDLRPQLETLARDEGLSDVVEFTGYVSEEDKIKQLTRARCLVLPSEGEGFGIVYIEAMRLGRPCLVSTRDAGQEVVNPPEAGLSADPDDDANLVAALARLMRPGREWDAWSRASTERYERLFTARQFQGRLVSALDG